MQAQKIIAAVSPKFPQFIDAVEFIIPERSVLNVQPLLERVRVSAHTLDFGYRIFRYDHDITPTEGFQFSGLCVDSPTIRCYLYAHVAHPHGRVYLTPKSIRRHRLDCFRRLTHESIHAEQFRENERRGTEESRLLGSTQERYLRSRSFPRPHFVDRDLKYLSDFAEVEAYASCIALEWVCTPLRDLSWRSFLKFWRTNHRQVDADNHMVYDEYARYFESDWSTHSVMRRLKLKVREFAEQYRALSVLTALQV